MRGEWRSVTIKEIAEVIGGGTPSTKDAANFGGPISWITPRDLSTHSGRYISRGERSITEKGLSSSSARKLPPKTVLLTTRAPVGYLAIAVNELTTNQGFRSLVVRSGFSPEFVYYLLLNDVERLRSFAVGSTFQELSGSTLKGLDYLVPPLPEQEAVACVLGALDDKIELNRQMNRTLEAMAWAIFKTWFVDFDPVRAKAKGRDPDLPEKTADLFPDAFEESPLGPIPRRWTPSSVGTDFQLTMGQSPPGSTYNETENGLPFYQGRRDFGFRFPSRRVFCTAPTRFAEPGDTLVSVRAPVGDVNMASERCTVGRGVAAIRHRSGSRSFTYYSMHNLRNHFQRFEAEGTVFGCINKADFERLGFVAPPTEVLNAFDRMVTPLDDRIEWNERQSSTLARLRDVLLPKLISGEVQVEDAERIVRRSA